MSNVEFQNNPQIFTTGSFLKPMKIIDDNGKEFWVWYVSEFIDDTYKDGLPYNPQENATSYDKLVLEME